MQACISLGLVPSTSTVLQNNLACLFTGLGIALGVTSLVAVIMTGVTTVLCCKLRSLGSTDVHM